MNKGIASNPIIHRFASQKGGKVTGKKGLATLSEERRKEIAIMGGKAHHEYRGRQKKPEATTDISIADIADLDGILGNVDEQV